MRWEDVKRPLKVQHDCEMPTDTGETISFEEFLARFAPIKPSRIDICYPPIFTWRSTNTEGPKFYIWVPSEEIEQQEIAT